MGDEAEAAEAAYWEWCATAPPGATSDPHYFDNEGSPTRDRVYAAREQIHGSRTRRSYVCAYNEDELTGGNGMGDLTDAYERHADNEWEAEMRERLAHASPKEREEAATWGRGVLKSFFGSGYEPSDTAVTEMATSYYDTRTGGSTMSARKSKLELAQERLERILRDAQAQADEVEKLTRRASTNPEPDAGMVVTFDHAFARRLGGYSQPYSYAAIRVGDVWYHTGGSEAQHNKLPQPCSWDEIVDFADTLGECVELAGPEAWQQAVEKTLNKALDDEGDDLNSEAWAEHDKVVDREAFLFRCLVGLRDQLDIELMPGKRVSKEPLHELRRALNNDLDRHAKMKEEK